MDLTIHGVVAGILTTGAFMPQVIKSWRTRHTKDLSAGMLVLLTSGAALWLLYGIRLNDMPIIGANGVTLLLIIALIIAKIKYG
jgi:MtN3 and saliva related transmembrane protein